MRGEDWLTALAMVLGMLALLYSVWLTSTWAP